MNLFKDMQLFVEIVHCQGMAAAGREIGMTASSVTMRINNLEEYYGVKLLTRTTRSVNLTYDGNEFYKDCLNMIDTMTSVENKLRSTHEKISGTIKITATCDFGRQYIAPLIDKFIALYPDVKITLELNDYVLDLGDNKIDFAIRHGISSDSNLIARKLINNKLVLCASPEYFQRCSIPSNITDLKDHSCLTMTGENTGVHDNKWYFDMPYGERCIDINPSRSCNDGHQIRRWALEGAGIALKSNLNVINDINAGRLMTIFNRYKPGFQCKNESIGTNLYMVYNDRKHIPKRTRKFMDYMQNYFDKLL